MEAFFTKIVTSLQKVMNESAIEVGRDHAKIICECIYCGRSKRSLPHLGIIIEPLSDNKITGGINCFRCGVSNSLKEFLLSISDNLKIHGITTKQIQSNVIVKSIKEKIFYIDFMGLMHENFIEQHNFYYVMKNKYKGREEELKLSISTSMNGFSFIKEKLDLNLNYTVYDAYRILKSVKAKCNKRLQNITVCFDKKINYICNTIEKKEIKFDNDLDETLYGSNTFECIVSSNSYSKKKLKEIDGKRYYVINDSNYKKEDGCDIINIYVCEGIFDTLSIKFYKNRFSLDKINIIRKNILNFYVAVCHSRIDKFIHEYINGFDQTKEGFPTGVKELNIIMVPDLNMNVRKYISSIYKYIEYNQSHVNNVINKNITLKIYYLDLQDHFSHFQCNDVNDIVRTCDRRHLKNIEAINIF